MKIKILKVDSIARQKGFRRGQTCEVIAMETNPPTCNSVRGPLAVARLKSGKAEGFFPDQYRIRVQPQPGEFDPPDDQEPRDLFVHSQRVRYLQEKTPDR